MRHSEAEPGQFIGRCMHHLRRNLVKLGGERRGYEQGSLFVLNKLANGMVEPWWDLEIDRLLKGLLAYGLAQPQRHKREDISDVLSKHENGVTVSNFMERQRLRRSVLQSFQPR